MKKLCPFFLLLLLTALHTLQAQELPVISSPVPQWLPVKSGDSFTIRLVPDVTAKARKRRIISGITKSVTAGVVTWQINRTIGKNNLQSGENARSGGNVYLL